MHRAVLSLRASIVNQQTWHPKNKRLAFLFWLCYHARKSISGRGEVWYRARFGSERFRRFKSCRPDQSRQVLEETCRLFFFLVIDFRCPCRFHKRENIRENSLLTRIKIPRAIAALGTLAEAGYGNRIIRTSENAVKHSQGNPAFVMVFSFRRQML